MVKNSISKAIPPGRTREEIAKAVGISRVHFQRIIGGKQMPTIEIVLRISAVLQKPVDQLFYLDDEPKFFRMGQDPKP